MKYLITLLILLPIISIGQNITSTTIGAIKKQVLTHNSRKEWPEIASDYSISNNGLFVYYRTFRRHKQEPSKGHVKYLKTGTIIEFPIISQFEFAANNTAVFIGEKDTLQRINLTTQEIFKYPSVYSFKLFKDKNDFYLLIQKKTSNSITILDRNFSEVYQDSQNKFISLKGHKLFLASKENENTYSIISYNFQTKRKDIIWKGEQPLDQKTSMDNKFVYLLLTTNSESVRKIISINLEDKITQEYYLTNGGNINEIETISRNNRFLTLSIKKDIQTPSNKNNEIGLRLWRYNDPILPSALKEKRGIESTKNSLDLITGKLISLEHDGFKVITNLTDTGSYVVLKKDSEGNQTEKYWNNRTTPSYIVISRTNESHIDSLTEQIESIEQSPNGRFWVYFKPLSQEYMCHDLYQKKSYSLTTRNKNIWTTKVREDDDWAQYSPIGIAGWDKSGNRIFIYDQYDIILFDLLKNGESCNITNSSGAKDNIAFRFAMSPTSPLKDIEGDSNILLTAFNRNNKKESFYLLSNKKDHLSLKLLSEHDKVIIGTPEQANPPLLAPRKASDAQKYLVMMQTETEYPNIFLTTEFKKFEPVTNIHPENGFYRYSAELIKWKGVDMIQYEGVLYKPENIDENKRYPLVVLYYEKFSNGLHQFDIAETNGAEINIDFYTSNGYAVFIPDIKYGYGNPGQSAYNSVVSGVLELASKQWIDTSRIGLCGHSFGGYQTNYIITHTNMFKAAISNSSWSNFLSSSNKLTRSGNNALYYYETFRQRMRSNMWERPDLYIQSSPLFLIHKVKTPLLMMNNREDSDVPFYEGIQFFLGMRRLGKKVWLLDYKGAGHLLLDEKQADDLNIRMQQFFDFYLKNGLQPIWMSSGVKNSNNSYDLLPKDEIDEGSIMKPEMEKKAEDLKNREKIQILLDDEG